MPAFSGNDRWGGYVGVAQDPQVPMRSGRGTSTRAAGATGRRSLAAPDRRQLVRADPAGSGPRYAAGASRSACRDRSRRISRGRSQVGGVVGIPANAIAVTGNVTVVNQTAGGYLSVTPTAVANPMSSTINFPLGDTRANNLTVPLAPNGKLAAVYKAPAGKTTHLIVDVTGYFLPGDEDATYAPITPGPGPRQPVRDRPERRVRSRAPRAS